MAVLVIVLVVIALLVIGFSIKSLPGIVKDRGFSEAILAYDNHMISDAMKKFQTLLYEEPYNCIFHWYVAMCALQRQEYTTAIYHLESILQINNFHGIDEHWPDIESFSKAGVYRKLMEIYGTLKLKDKLLLQLEKLIELEPKNEEYYLRIAEFQINEKNYSEKTQTYLEKILSINPRNGYAQFLLSLIYFKNGLFEQALQAAEKAITLDRSLSDANFIMGFARYRINLKDEAERLFREATLCKYFRKSTSFYLAKLMVSAGQIDYALPYAAEAAKYASSIHEDPSIELEAKYLYASLLEQTDHFTEAYDLFRSIQNIQPDYQDVSKRLKYMEPVNAEARKKKVQPDFLEVFKNMKLDDFSRYSEKIIEKIGYKIKKVDLVNGNTINMLAYENDPAVLTGVFIRRGIGIIQEDHIKGIEHFMSGMQVITAILITPNDFNPSSKKMAEKKGIQTINGEKLKDLLDQIK